MTKEERLARLKNHGYNPIHLIGNWYWVRLLPNKKFYHIITKIA